MDTKRVLETAHAMIAGATGCGKSTLLHRVLCDAIQDRSFADGEFYLIDLKRGVEFCDYIGLPMVTRFAIDVEQALDTLDEAIRIMERRLDAMRMVRQKMYRGRDIWIVIDELAFLLQSAKKAALPRLQTISQQGRAARVHLILATQNPSRSAIPAPIQQNVTLKIGLHCTTATESRQVVGVAGCESLPKHGRVLIWDGGFVEKDDVQMLADEERAAIINSVRGARHQA